MFHVKQLFKKRKRGVALGGGGVRSFSSIGVLRYFEKKSLKIDCISGTSMGAVVGGLYSFYRSSELVDKKIREIYKSPLFKQIHNEFDKKLMPVKQVAEPGITQKVSAYYTRFKFFQNILTENHIVSSNNLRKLIKEFIPDVDIKDLPIKFCCTATDISRGEKIIFRKGSLQKAVLASISVPGVLEPEKSGLSLLSDGGSLSLTPVEELIEIGADYLIGVEVFPQISLRDSFKNGMEIIERCARLTSKELHKRQLRAADLVISPDVKKILWFDFSTYDYVVLEGEKAAAGKEKFIK